MTGGQMSLLDVEPQGRSRRTDPVTSVAAGRRARVASQRRHIARLLHAHGYTTADDCWNADKRDCRPDRASYSTRLGGLVEDDLLTKGEPVDRADRHGQVRQVVTYWPTDAGRQWIREVLSDGATS